MVVCIISNDQITVLILLETVGAKNELDQILSIPGARAFRLTITFTSRFFGFLRGLGVFAVGFRFIQRRLP